jgi:hypothetical protein
VSIERRRIVRHSLYLAAELVVEGTTPRTAITKDVSELGFLLLTRANLNCGDSVVVKIYPPGDEMRSVDVPGKVVRLEELADVEKGIWRKKVAFAFDRAQPDLAQEFEQLAAEQAKIFAPKRKRG